MATTIRFDQIRSTDWQPRLSALGAVVEGVDDVDQCIRTILLTPLGSVPHRPDFGADVYRYLDHPIIAARPHLVRAILEAVARWEPRVEVTRVAVEVGEELGSLEITLERRLRGTPEVGTTLVRIAS